MITNIWQRIFWRALSKRGRKHKSTIIVALAAGNWRRAAATVTRITRRFQGYGFADPTR
jgi:hypothetical protein